MSESKKLTPFERAVVDSILMEYQNIPNEAEIANEFSVDFQMWSHKLIRKTQKSYWYYVNTTVKKVILIAIILSMMTMTAMAVPSIREAIIDFFFNNHGVRYGITFNPEEAATAPENIETVLFPSYIPDEFALVDQSCTTGVAYGFWASENAEIISYAQNRVPRNATADTWIGIDAEDVTKTTQIIGEYLVEIVWYNESYCLYWTDNSYVYSLELPNSISEEVMIEIFSSIQPIDQGVNQNGG